MSITDELREWMFDHTVNCSDDRIALVAIADRIDAEHESKVSYWQDASYKDGYDEGFASADDYFTDKRETLKEHGWVKLPVDADGVPIHVGDRLTDSAEFKSEGVVESLMLEPTGWSVHFGAGWADERIHDWHHHYPPTVEDVLEEFAQMYIACNDKGTIAEYAAKLRLAGEGE